MISKTLLAAKRNKFASPDQPVKMPTITDVYAF
jgi:hypothetical protein